MIAFIQGTIADIEESGLVLDHNGMGFEITVPTPILNQVEPGDEILLYTHMSVREDDMSLFGFISRDDKKMFRLLTTVSGIGPKAAIGILSTLSADEIRFAVLGDDVKSICRAPGIGKKTAQKMILELKDKFDLEEVLEHQLSEDLPAQTPGTKPSGKESEDAVQALMALGYSSSESLHAVKSVKPTEDMTSDAILKAALKYLF